MKKETRYVKKIGLYYAFGSIVSLLSSSLYVSYLNKIPYELLEQYDFAFLPAIVLCVMMVIAGIGLFVQALKEW